MSRRSARLQQQGVVKAVDAVVDDTLSNSGDDEFRDAGEDAEEIEVVTKKKRRKVVKSTAARDQKVKRVRGRRGILSSLREFPLDIVAEIFGHLNPMDLLNLARTTKEIRGILMSRSSTFIWKESRSHVEGLPDPPRDLSEPQYANLCFSTHCHQCLAIPVSTIIWSARMRLCKKCIEAQFGNLECVTDKTKLELNLLRSLVPSYREPRWRRTQELFSIDVATRLKEESAAFRENGTLQMSDPKYKAWFTQKEDEMKEIKAHAELCVGWAANRTSERRNELDDARALRKEAIVERLTALGWGEEILLHKYEFSYHKLVNQPKKLTDRIWKNIEAPLVELLTDLKAKRLAAVRARIMRERRLFAAQVYNKFREALPPDVVCPAKIDVLQTEPFRVVIEDTPVDPEVEDILTEESFTAAISSLPEFSADWRQRKEEELVKIMQKIRPDSVKADLHLATTFFTCSPTNPVMPRMPLKIRVPLSIPAPLSLSTILVHPSTMAMRSGVWDPDSLERTLTEEAWNAAGRVRLHEQAQRNARFVVEACGLDPDITTSTEMDDINPALECLNCSGEDDRLVMRWIRATYHICGSATTPSWKRLNVDKERLLEAEERKDLQRRTSNSLLQDHLFNEHNISDMTSENLVCALDVGPSNRFPYPIRLKSSAETEAAEDIHTGNEIVAEDG
ncbi:F-box domain-containing protein [Mycena sanguinolenta]|uniref:F-box domain-containing protein n=1 Tax=Mycena sanguinolenta TaxID=230812 RepID=A0A8H7DHY6_9AGAR|nr:F-box domain-containing protein [Mycena sanguinolenta]